MRDHTRALCIMLSAVICLSGVSRPADAQAIKTWVRGQVLYVGETGEPIAYPPDFPRDLKEWFSVSLKDIHYASPRRPPIVDFDTTEHETLGDVPIYTATVEEDGVVFEVKFEYGIYVGKKQLEIRRHIGEAPPLHIYVERHFDSEQEAYLAFLAMLDNPNPSIDELYRQSRILQHRTRRESKRTHYLDLARLFRKILDVTGSIRSSQLGYLSSFDQEETFRALSVRERFDVLRNFGLIFTKTAQAQAPLEDGVSSYADIGQYLLERALRIAELDVEAGESSVPAEDIANAFREKFESETDAGKATEVIDTLNIALAPGFDFNERTRKSFLIDYVVTLEKISAYGPANGGNDPTDEAWINRVVNDPALAASRAAVFIC